MSQSTTAVNPPYGMRAACKKCGGRLGHIEVRSGQACVICACGAWQYNAPRVETGEHQRSVSTRTGITPSARARVFALHGHRCIACGACAADGAILHLDHLISRKQAEMAGCLDALIDSEHNLAPMCEECNLGKRAESTESIQLIYRVLLIKERLNTQRIPNEGAA